MTSSVDLVRLSAYVTNPEKKIKSIIIILVCNDKNWDLILKPHLSHFFSTDIEFRHGHFPTLYCPLGTYSSPMRSPKKCPTNLTHLILLIFYILQCVTLMQSGLKLVLTLTKCTAVAFLLSFFFIKMQQQKPVGHTEQ